MKYYILFLFSLFSFSQQTFKISDFSYSYYGLVTLEEGQENEVFKKGAVSIYKKDTNEEIIRVDSDELTFDLDEKGKIETNVVELPYGKQSLIISNDFNFDGSKDLAIMNGQFSCYHGPSYEIYLNKKGRLEYNNEFTSLAQDFCGMFQVDTEKKRLYTMTKSGCCWHQYSTYKIMEGSPVAIEIVEEDATSFPYIIALRSQMVDAKMQTSKIKYLSEEVSDKLAGTFQLKNSKKQVYFFEYEGFLHYCFTNENKEVAFSFPVNNYSSGFIRKENSIQFTNADTTYEVLLDKKNCGIWVNQNGKKTWLEGDVSSLKVYKMLFEEPYQNCK
jgi:hypothetical protein